MTKNVEMPELIELDAELEEAPPAKKKKVVEVESALTCVFFHLMYPG